MVYTLYADDKCLGEFDLKALLVYLIANRVAELPIEEAREQLELLTLIQENAP